jgi:hypothetical protein
MKFVVDTLHAVLVSNSPIPTNIVHHHVGIPECRAFRHDL